MADHTKIEWTDASWNPLRARNIESGGIGHFCVHASPGCANCYAERMQPRFGNRVRFAAQDAGKVELFLDEHALTKPLRWKKPRMIFVCSMTDLFADFVPDEWIDRAFAVMALCPQHTFQVLTKRSKRMREYLIARNGVGNSALCQAINAIPAKMGNRRGVLVMPLPNVWPGVSVEDQPRADERIPDLLATPAAVRWISAEPLLGPVDLRWIAEPDDDKDGVIDALLGCNWIDGMGRGVAFAPVRPGHEGQYMTRWVCSPEADILANRKIDWIVCGGESGPGARPMHPDWARTLRDQCAAAGVPFFFKQWGLWLPGFDTCPPRCRGWRVIGNEGFANVGKKRAGRLLDGVTHDAMPVQSRAEGLGASE